VRCWLRRNELRAWLTYMRVQQRLGYEMNRELTDLGRRGAGLHALAGYTAIGAATGESARARRASPRPRRSRFTSKPNRTRFGRGGGPLPPSFAGARLPGAMLQDRLEPRATEGRAIRPGENPYVRRRNLLLKMELRSSPECLCVVRGAVEQLAERLGFPERERRAVVLAIDEALTNVIRHAYAGDPERPIEVSFRRIRALWGGASREALEIVLVDRGRRIDRAKLHGRALEDERPGGRGLHLIRENMDAVEFRRAVGRNRLRLVKLLPVPRPPRDP